VDPVRAADERPGPVRGTGQVDGALARHRLRNRFDSYGVTPNNASISLRVEFPSSRVEQRDEERRYLTIRRPQALILGADAQTLSWAQVVLDFPELRAQDSPVANYLKMASGSYPLTARSSRWRITAPSTA
jgi:hypothetical protein